MAYSRKPLCKAIELNVPMHPLSFLSTPVSHVTNRGLQQKQLHYLYKNHIDFRTKSPLYKKEKSKEEN